MFQQPDYSSAFNSITHLNNEQLKELLNNDSKFEEMMKDLKQFKDLEQEREVLLAHISSLSEFNLNREPLLIEGREKIRELSESGEELSQRVVEKMNDLRAKTGDLSTDTALALLQAAAAEMEEESERVAQNFLSGDLDIEDFFVQFAEMRKIMHLRKVKAEKMSELITRPSFNAGSNYINAPPVSINTNYFPNMNTNNPLPYPTGPLNMPNPYFSNNF